VQRALGRLRAMGLALIVFVKINYFGWTLFFWGVCGMAIAYGYHYDANYANTGYGPAKFEEEGGLILFLFGLAWAMIGRMLLLRWRRGALIGLALAALLLLAMTLGAHLRQLEYSQPLPSPMAAGFMAYMFFAALGALVGASVAWGVWLSLTHAFLPKRAAVALIEWQRAMSLPKGKTDRTDATTSVTA
jgi:hypothetical protein